MSRQNDKPKQDKGIKSKSNKEQRPKRSKNRIKFPTDSEVYWPDD